MKNFLYSKSDLFVALVIVVVAAFIIFTRVDVIMGGAASKEINGGELQPAPLEPQDPISESAAESASGGDTDVITPDAPVTPPDTDETTDPVEAEDSLQADEADEEADTDATDTVGTEPVLFTVEVGTNTSTIAKNLAAAGLVKSSDAFLKEVTRQKAETKMKAGTFKIKPGSSVSKIVKVLTK